jgi:hypothetical protein
MRAELDSSRATRSLIRIRLCTIAAAQRSQRVPQKENAA